MAGNSERVGAVVSMRSMGELLVFDPKGPIDAARVGAFASTLDDARHVADTLIQLGFEITNFHPMAISFSGTPADFRDSFGVTLQKSSKPGGRGRSIDVFAPDADHAPRLLHLPEAFEGRADGVAIACPPKLIDDTSLPVRGVQDDDRPGRCLPDELAMSIWGNGLVSLDATGDGIVAALISTGHYRHRFFAERRYRVLPTLLGPGQRGSLQDEHGHGTGEAACLFAAAPNVRLRPIKGLLDPVGDMLLTIDSRPKPNLIVNSWGYDIDQASWDQLKADDLNLHNYLRLLEAAVAYAAAQGIVVASAAPRTWQSFPTSHPDVIAIGASIATIANEMAAMDGACEFDETVAVSGLYPGRHVPDFWSQAGDEDDVGLDRSFTQPAQPGSILDKMGLVDAEVLDEGWAWCDLDQASFPLAASMIAVLLERYRG
ncbi:MAG: hypothetical protein ACR2QF_14120, partial [Geminicoccaceae bacterium]